MSLRSMKYNKRQSLGILPVPIIVIDWFNLFGKYQQDILVFTDRKSWIIGDGDVALIGVDGGGVESEAPPKIENENYLDYQEYQEEVHPEQEYQTIIRQPIKL